jgi:capsular polysaccharide biosynthesis protein
MSEVRPAYDDEIDLFEFFETLWDGKWLISAFVVLTTLIGFGYSQVTEPKYDVSVPFRVNVYSVLSQQICESNNQNQRDWRASDCLADGTLGYFVERLGSGWSLNSKSSAITYTTPTPSSVNAYEDVLSNALTSTNEALRSEAISELASIESVSNDNVLATERVATNMLNAKRVIQSIDNGQSAITFGSVSVVKSSPKVPLILALSVVLGGMIGVFFILVRNAITKRKEQLAKA